MTSVLVKMTGMLMGLVAMLLCAAMPVQALPITQSPTHISAMAQEMSGHRCCPDSNPSQLRSCSQQCPVIAPQAYSYRPILSNVSADFDDRMIILSGHRSEPDVPPPR